MIPFTLHVYTLLLLSTEYEAKVFGASLGLVADGYAYSSSGEFGEGWYLTPLGQHVAARRRGKLGAGMSHIR